MFWEGILIIIKKERYFSACLLTLYVLSTLARVSVQTSSVKQEKKMMKNFCCYFSYIRRKFPFSHLLNLRLKLFSMIRVYTFFDFLY